MDADTGLETKVIAGDEADAMGEFLNAFEAFKDANDERLAQIEKRMSADVVTTEKVERIDKALDELTLKFKRPQLGTNEKPLASEHKAAFEAYVRKGETAQLSGIESKAMSVGSNPDGGYLVPPETEAHIESRSETGLADPRRGGRAAGLVKPLQEALRHYRCGERLGG